MNILRKIIIFFLLTIYFFLTNCNCNNYPSSEKEATEYSSPDSGYDGTTIERKGKEQTKEKEQIKEECSSDSKRPCYSGPIDTKNIGVCQEGYQICKNGTWSDCQGQILPKKQENCENNLDDTCVGIVNKDCSEQNWAISAGGRYDDNPVGIAKDNSNFFYIAGNFGGEGRFGEHSIFSRGKEDIFVAKLDSTGKFVWATSAGGKEMDLVEGNIETDSKGNSYITGRFSDKFYYKTYFGQVRTADSKGHFDIFIAKVDSYGNFVWMVSAGGTGWDQGNNIVLGEQNKYVYVFGYFHQIIHLGQTTLTSEGEEDIFVAKLECDTGKVLWAISSNSQKVKAISPNSIARDNSGNIFITGYFRGTVGLGTITLSVPLGYYLAKINGSTGRFLWAISLPVKSFMSINSTISDKKNDIFLTGIFEKNLQIETINLTSQGGRDIFIAKINGGTGKLIWATSIGGKGNDVSGLIVVDNLDNIYIPGGFEQEIILGNKRLSSHGKSDAFLAKLDGASGKLIWATSDGGLYGDIASGVVLAHTKHLYLIGTFNEATMGTPSGKALFGKTLLTSSGGIDIFVWKIDKK
jgi:hypothetical protein